MDDEQYEEEALQQSNALGLYSFSSFEDDEDFIDVDDDYADFEEDEGFDNYDEDDEDDEFDEFGKRARERRKKRRALRKSGVSRKEARKTARREVRQEMGRTKLGKLGQKIKHSKVGQVALKVGRGIGKGLKKVGLAVPRGAYLLLMTVNFRGLANKTGRAKDKPQYSKQWKRVKEKWNKLGGKLSKLEKAVNKGKNRKPFLCGKKCKRKLASYSNFSADGSVSVDMERLNRDVAKMQDNFEYYNAVDPATLSIAIGSGATIVTTMAGILSSVKADKRTREALKNEREKNDREMDLMEDVAKKQLELAETKVINSLDPRTQILNNPNLTGEQKKQGIKEIDEALGDDKEPKGKGMGNKMLIGGGILVGVVLVIWAIAKRKR